MVILVSCASGNLNCVVFVVSKPLPLSSDMEAVSVRGEPRLPSQDTAGPEEGILADASSS